MLSLAVSAEYVREALHCLYDPAALSVIPLARLLQERGTLRSPQGLHELLLAAIEQLRPPPGTPSRSPGWRRHRYLRLRYVDCASHGSVAEDLGISVRHASRVHQEALRALAARLVPEIREALPQPLSAHVQAPSSRPVDAQPVPSHRPGSSLEAELAVVGRQPAEGAVDVSEVLQGVCGTLEGVAASHRVRFDVVVAGDLPTVKINRVCLRQILFNLLLALIQSTRETAVVVRAERAGDAVVVTTTCRPNGRDGAEARQRAAEGVSLVAAARHLARLQGACVDEDSAQSSFRLRLPTGVPLTILLIDDNPDVGELFQRMLAQTAYSVVHIRTADRALRFATEACPDLIVLDVVMPARDGWELLTELRNHLRTAAVPVVVCSILPDRELALSLGAADFLAKPVSRSTLLAVLDGLLAGKDATRSAPPTSDQRA